MDFYRIIEVEVEDRKTKQIVLEIYPDFRICRSKDLMIRGADFYAVWNNTTGLWSTDEYDVQDLIDLELREAYENAKERFPGTIRVKYLGNFSSGIWLKFQQYIKSISDSYHQLDESLTFSDEEVRKEDFVSRRLPYSLNDQDCPSYEELIGTLYNTKEREKLEWSIGSIVCGDSRTIQKFSVLYGSGGSGKSTALNIVEKLFEGYTATFDAKSLGGNNNLFSTEAFRSNPLVAIQQDGDLSRIEDNTKLNSIVSHEYMFMNEKHKSGYTSRVNAFLFMGTNKPVKITDAKSGIIRRLIDIRPSGRKVSAKEYQVLTNQIRFELGSIATHCLSTYRRLGKDFYANYRPIDMMLQTDIFFNYIESYYDVFSTCDGITLQQAYDMYKTWCSDSMIANPVPRYKFRNELGNYFTNFEERAVVDGIRVRSYYTGFIDDAFHIPAQDVNPNSLVLDCEESLLDDLYFDRPAQYANEHETPTKKWKDVGTTLSDLDTTKLHYVKPPDNHIVIDFDLRNENGEKDKEKNIEAASDFPPTYAEFSKGGGLHLHYIWDGDVLELSSLYSEGIEVKVFTGDSSLRRRLSLCNDIPVTTINSGLPRKEKKIVTSEAQIKTEKSLRELIFRNLRKEIHPATKPSVDFIKKILDDAYSNGLTYNVEDLRPKIIAFANGSSNQAILCIKTVSEMKFKSEEKAEPEPSDLVPKEAPIVFFDIEIFPNLFVLNWKYEGSNKCVRMINPPAADISKLLKFRLVGFNNLKYDNHILYAAAMGYSVEQLYALSQRIINHRTGFFGEAYGLSYTDIYDFAAKKQSLKKWEIELGITHKELGLPWDQPVPQEKWYLVAEYCDNDVFATEEVWKHLQGDFLAREIIAVMSGLTVNDPTNKHSAKIIFGNDKDPQSKFIYTDLATGHRYSGANRPAWQNKNKNGNEYNIDPYFETDPVSFPGYTYDFGKSEYKGQDPSEGGRVQAKPGIYKHVALLDIASMHPSSIENLNLFGTEYTKNFSRIKQARILIKHKQFDEVRRMFEGTLDAYLTDESVAKALSNALKIVINSVYGLTSAHFKNAFRDDRNVDNIVAKRGALFMIDLEEFVESRGFVVIHTKTDSIKIADATPEIIDEVMEFGHEYGYDFEHEATYEKLCLVNKAVYVAKTEEGREPAHWTATGTQFINPYVFKTLFSKEPIEFDDYIETKAVTSALYLDYEEEPHNNPEEASFIGKVGAFVPVSEGGGRLMREKDGVLHNATGGKGWKWKEAATVKELKQENIIDMKYYRTLVDDAKDQINKYGDSERFCA